MAQLQNKELLELKILKHVEQTPRLNNRIAAAKLGCSVKLAHELLKKMVDRGLLHVKKHHSRRWDYFLTGHGIAEKARLTYEFIDFSMHFYNEARKQSSRVCKEIADSGKKRVAIVGCGDLAEITYLGIKEWNLELVEVFANDAYNFLGHKVKPLSELPNSVSEAIIICLYDAKNPMKSNYLPENIERNSKMFWIFKNENKPEQIDK